MKDCFYRCRVIFFVVVVVICYCYYCCCCVRRDYFLDVYRIVVAYASFVFLLCEPKTGKRASQRKFVVSPDDIVVFDDVDDMIDDLFFCRRKGLHGSTIPLHDVLAAPASFLIFSRFADNSWFLGRIGQSGEAEEKTKKRYQLPMLTTTTKKKTCPNRWR